jgi:hypothetical protein
MGDRISDMGREIRINPASLGTPEELRRAGG